ncbi:hypothetical protein [Salinibacillus xinjiangensis]|uniref:DUF4367 domain-containing protein n=1 Tax=Salinibacillus xinjiangensis TaxID=1229268 RepID=A0A6G1X8A1_9BACI|nr:hypothetical protein [Salinibacillus xinjiangensis]MRG87136.1 hypothetical protein [Salinibacillus xinjiangensis]
MKKSRFDDKLQHYFTSQTNDMNNLKDHTWENIQQRLFTDEEPESKKPNRFVVGVAMLAVVVMISIGTSTTTGQAIIGSLKELFEPNKQVDIAIEGDKEETEVTLETKEELDYIIYVDDSRYKMVKGDTDRIVPKQELGEQYPEVSMEISQHTNTTIEEQMKKATNEVINEGLAVRREGPVNEPLPGKFVKYMEEEPNEWDSPVYKYYFFESGGNVFVIKQEYFLEASEGHGVRFDSMLESFEIVK